MFRSFHLKNQIYFSNFKLTPAARGLKFLDKWQIIHDFSQNQRINHLILQNESDNCLPLAKVLSQNSVLVSCWSENIIFSYPNAQLTSSGRKILFVVNLLLLSKLFRPYLEIEEVAYKNDLKLLHERSWIIWLTFNVGNVDLSSKLSVPYNTYVYSVENEDNNIFIYSTYTVNHVFFYNIWGDWRSQSGVTARPGYKRLLSGVSLKRQFLNESIYGPYNALLKPGQEYLNGIANILNFSYTLLNTSDTDYFQFDISDVSTMMMSPYVSSIVGPTMKIKMFIFIKESSELMLSSYFMYPFHANMWHALICWIVIAMASIAIIHFVAHENHVLVDNVTSVLEAFCNQSGSWIDISPHSRIYRVATWLTVGIVVPSYTAVIIAFMTVRQVNLPFENLHGLANDGRYRLGVQKGSAPLFFLKMDKSLSEDLERVLVPEVELPIEVVSAASLVCEGHYAFIGYNDIIRSIPNICNIVKLKKPIIEMFSALFLTPLSPLASPFTQELVIFWSNGLMNHFQKVADETAQIKENPSVYPVEFGLIEDLHIILGCGLAVSLCLFLSEHLKRGFA